MAEFVQITTTLPRQADAELISAALVDRRLAGCVQVAGPIKSTYRWHEQVETAEEWLCIVKTERGQIAAIERLLAELHPYELPELIATPIVAGGAGYLQWLGEQIGNGESGNNR
jgi:periplasmic divalent cation tolerance protein